ncbi:hypothetical protein ACF1A9_11150 [Streptomyces sp. NPDC014872]|uniref:hypothetical protein n=1 Tax=Streptomyces sp. NPDC014872 TaxID=3364926 RepID=UPI0036FD993A
MSGAFESTAEEGVDAERRQPTTTPEAEVPDAATPLTIVGEAVRALPESLAGAR